MTEFDVTRTGINIGKAVIVILLLSFIGIVVYKNYFANGGPGGRDVTRVPTEMQINYIPADYQMGKKKRWRSWKTRNAIGRPSTIWSTI